MTSQPLYSILEVAARLNLHVKTVRSYVREGRLKATRIGKQYRIAHADLEAFTGQPVSPDASKLTMGSRHVDVSSIVQIDAIDREAAQRMTNHLLNAAKNHPQQNGPLRIDSAYDEDHARLKIIITGSIAATSYLLMLVSLRLEQAA